jgi:hypothetical protein
MEEEGDCPLATAAVATDPAAEQSPEVEGRRTKHWKRGLKRRRDDGGATTTAMWNGCRRGDFFEGCEGAAGEATERPDLSACWMFLASPVFGQRRRGGVVDGRGNAANPFRYRDATSLEPVRGENRRGGAKPRGRNEPTGAASGRPTAAATPPGVDTSGDIGGGATIERIPREASAYRAGNCAARTSDRIRRSGGEPRSRGTLPDHIQKI